MNKQLHIWLHSENANIVWKQSRKSMLFWKPPADVAQKDRDDPGDITDLKNATRHWEPVHFPEPPEGMSEFDFAFLIFGEKVCTVGARKVEN